MINANSPICVRLNPDSIAIFRLCPVASIPKVPKTIIPSTTTTDSVAIVLAYCTMILVSTIIPTDMKNTAPKRSFTGFTRCSICSASHVPASIEPITKAPSAIENPEYTENTAIKKHMPIATTSNISSLISRCAYLKNDGIRYTPTVNHITRKNTSLAMLISNSLPSTLLLSAIDESSTIITTANKSSQISTASTWGTKRR